MKLLLILILCLNIFASSKHLSSQDRAEVHAQNLIEGGYYEDANKFLEKARVKYSKSETLWIFSAKVEYELKDFDSAKIYFIKTLEINPKNEQAAHFKELIQKQEKALENKTLVNLFGYLKDKGIDFLSIFLAFLGGEIIARKYSRCNTIDEKNLPLQYFYQSELNKSIYKRILFTFRNYIELKKIMTFCFFFHLIIIFLISCSILISILLIELFFEINIGTSISLSHMNESQLLEYVLIVFFFTIICTISIKFIMYINYLSQDSLSIKIELTQYLENLSSSNRLDKLYEVIKEFESLGVKKEKIINDLMSEDCKIKIKYIYSNLEKINV